MEFNEYNESVKTGQMAFLTITERTPSSQSDIAMWCIECKYAANAEKELTHDVDANDLDAPSYHKEKGWRTLLIDARTGQIIDPEDESSKRYIYSDK